MADTTYSDAQINGFAERKRNVSKEMGTFFTVYKRATTEIERVQKDMSR